MLLEAGEENAAVLLARSALPDEIDTNHDLDALVAFGLDHDQVDEVARLTIGATDSCRARRNAAHHLAPVGQPRRPLADIDFRLSNTFGGVVSDLTALADPERLRSGWLNGIKHWQVDYTGACPVPSAAISSPD